MNRSQHSSSSDSSSRWSSKETPKQDLNLTIQGSAVQRATRPPRPKRKLAQPPNSPAHRLSLPVDRAIFRSELNRRLEEGCEFSTRPNSVASSHPDLALDLMSESDSCRRSERSTAGSSCDESEWSEGWTPHRPLLPTSYPSSRTYSIHGPTAQSQKKIPPPKPCGRVQSLSCTSSSTRSLSNRQSTERTQWSCQKCSNRSSGRSHADLIGVYVETVKNTELSKFFRPCVACNEICCQCPPSPLRLELCTTCGCKQCECRLECERCGHESVRPKSEPRTEPTLVTAELPIFEIACTSDEDRNSIVSRYLLERRFSPAVNSPPERRLGEQNGDSGNSTLQLEDSGREAAPSTILSRQHVSLSVMQLATAAQCARILADSLESVLELAKEELTEGSGSSVAATETAFNHKSLLSAITDLTYSDQLKQKTNELKKETVNE